MKPEEYLELFKKDDILRIRTINMDNFEENIWENYFVPAEEVVIELRYEKEEPPLNKHWNYGSAGDEGDDRIFLKLNNAFKRFPYSLSGSNSGSRTLCAEMFSGKNPKIKEIDKKLWFLLHDLSENKIVGTVKGYHPEKILNLEQEKFGHAVMTEWKMNLPTELHEKFKWNLKD